MVQCQRSYRYLEDAHQQPDGTWVCPGPPWTPADDCSGGEQYRRLDDDRLIAFFDTAFQMAEREFGLSVYGPCPREFIFGLIPQHIFEPRSQTSFVYVQTGSDPLQLRLQLAHEAFHAVASRAAFHWTHEMLAVLFSLRVLDATGFAQYAEINRYHHAANSHDLPRNELVKVASLPYPEGIYDAAWALGTELETIVGWKELRRLARSLGPTGRPDVEGWLVSLPDELAQRARLTLMR